MIRLATMDDLPGMVALLADEWRRGPHAGIAVDEPTLAGFTGAHIVEDDGAAWVSETKGRIRGVLLASIGTVPVSDAPAATDNAFVCRSGEGRQLLRAMTKWADARGAVMTSISVSSGHPTAGRVIESVGFERMGGIYYRSAASE